MRYASDHKPRTRARIVAAASRLFRREGFAGVGVAALMAEAGLTHGGFYAHFRDKTALLVDALEHAFAEARGNLLPDDNALTGAAWVRFATERYLTSRHRARPEQGCAVPALGAEVARGEPAVRRAFERHVRELVDGLAARLAPAAPASARPRAIALLATWAGAMLLARAVHDAAFAEEILAACRAQIAAAAPEASTDASATART